MRAWNTWQLARRRGMGKARQGSSFPIVGTTQLPVLTPWKPARLSLPSMSKKSVTASSSLGTWQDKIAAAEQRVKERREEEQRLRRRLRTSPPDDFKRRLDELMEDENGHEG